MNDKLFDLYGFTWSEAPEHLKKCALHLSSALKIDKFEAYELLRKDFNLGSVKMHLNKRIPIGAGLGGGSSDASFVIKGLNKIFDLGLTVNQLELYALKLGADCPFFIDNTPKHVTGVGENMSNIDVDLSNFNIKLHFSKKHISTSHAYSIINPVDKNYNLPTLVNNHISKWKNYIKNDFEVPIFLENPQLAAAKNDFYNSGAIYSSMSGTGSAVYGIFEKTTHS